MRLYAFFLLVAVGIGWLLFMAARFLCLAVGVAKMKESGLSDEEIDQVLRAPK